MPPALRKSLSPSLRIGYQAAQTTPPPASKSKSPPQRGTQSARRSPAPALQTPARPAPRPGPRLTRRERATLECLLRGLSDKLAAVELGISRRGIRRHVQALYLKFGVNSRLELAAVFLRLDRITIDASPLTR